MKKSLHEILLDPATYPHHPHEVTFRQTHVSRLYFAGGEVYKVKKSVNFGFLDFTSLDKRLFFCQEELRLNRRFAPDTYLEVVPICDSGKQLQLGGAGEPVEYALRMRRLPEERLLDHLLAQKTPHLAQQIPRLAQRLIEIYHKAPICRRDQGRSHVEVMAENWKENEEQTRPFIGTIYRAEEHRILFDRVKRWLAELTPLLQQREEEGLVRDGHGDLHSQHICLSTPIRIFDCIEFNRRFRIGDVAADFAFLAMDLNEAGRPDLAELLIDELTPCFGGDNLRSLLPFYRCYRAVVRSKVNALLSSEEEVDPETRQQAEAAARRYFRLAQGELLPPQLLLICGLMGVGKSSLAAPLSHALRADWLRSDLIRKELAGSEARGSQTHRFGQGLYSPQKTQETYDEMLRRTNNALRQGRSVIVDASFAQTSQRQHLLDLAAQHDVPPHIIYLQLPRRTALARLDEREELGNDPSDGRTELYDLQAATFTPPTAPEPFLRVDSSRQVDYNAGFVLQQLTLLSGTAS